MDTVEFSLFVKLDQGEVSISRRSYPGHDVLMWTMPMNGFLRLYGVKLAQRLKQEKSMLLFVSIVING